MTPLIHIRSYSTDQYFLDKIFYSNSYRLKKTEEKDLVAIDVGSHAGYFALTAISAGYKKVYCFEPLLENFKILLKNTEIFSGSVDSFQLGVFHESKNTFLKSPELNENQFLDYGNLEESTEDGVPVKLLSLNEVTRSFARESKIHLLKINTGTAFDFITNNEESLEKISNICFEAPYDKEELLIIKDKLSKLGFKDSLCLELKEKDQSFGFLSFFSKDNLEQTFDIAELRDKNSI